MLACVQHIPASLPLADWMRAASLGVIGLGGMFSVGGEGIGAEIWGQSFCWDVM
jgi:hypothetical protein